MAVRLNHHIVRARDGQASAAWWAEVLGLEPPTRFGPFWQLSVANGIDLDFDTVGLDGELVGGHYAFLVSEDDFDAIFARIIERGLEHYADPQGRRDGQINRHDGGRGTYFADPDGYWLEIITRPYGGG